MDIIRRQLPPLVKLAVPVVGAQLGLMGTAVVDAIMVGHLSRDALAASSIANAWLMAVLFFTVGLVQGIDPLITQAHGAGRRDHGVMALRRGIVLALALSVPVIMAIEFSEALLLSFGQDATLVTMAARYLEVQAWSVPCFLLFTAFRQYLQGSEIVKPMFYITLIANVFNAAANYGLIFGKFGFPALGLEGAGIATALTRGFMVVGLLLWIHQQRLIPELFSVSYKIFQETLRVKELLYILRFGLPVAFQMGLELSAFSLGTLIAGKLGASALAAHTIVLNIASLSFMVPLGISQGAVTRVGNLLGAHKAREAKHAAWVAIGFGTSTMFLFALIFLFGRYWLPGFYTTDAEVIATAALILPVAAAFQLFDGAQVVCSGILRGMGRPLASAVVMVLAFWCLALPIAYWLAIIRDWGITGLWWGLCLGLGIAALSMIIWIYYRGPETYSLQLE